MDQIDKLYTTSTYLLPWSTLLIGILGSLHCIGMCGGINIACSPNLNNNIGYQLGRLFSYSILALFSGVIGSFLNFSKATPMVSLISGCFIGLTFIWIGINSYTKKTSRIKLPSKIEKYIYKIWGKVLPKNTQDVKIRTSFLVGLVSILLPCGLLYSVIFALGALASPLLALLCIFTFWLGTLPLMFFSSEIFKKILNPLRDKLPLLMSSILILVGVGTIGTRIYIAYKKSCCH